MNLIEKVWGQEFTIINENYCGKILHVARGHRCSLHYHLNKDETLYVLDGEVELELDGRVRFMKYNDFQRIKPNQIHRFTGIRNSKIIEFANNHDEKDICRLEQDY